MNKFARIGTLGFIGVIVVICLASIIYAKAHGYDNQGFSISMGKVELANTEEIDLTGIENLNIQYTSQNVIFYEADGNQCVIKEYLQNKGANGETVIETDGNTVTITRKQNGGNTFSIGLGTGSERVEIYLPKSYCENIQAAVSSGNIHTEDALTLKSFCAAVTSGNIYCRDMSAGAVAVASTSGNVNLEKVSGAISAAAVSGNVDVECNESGEDIALSTTSGNIRLTIPKESSFTYEGRATSGNIRTDFDESLSFNSKGNEASGSYNGGTDFQIQTESTSGNTKIELQ